ncbi:MAG: alpha/beta hydrolase [Aeromicrobium sp.]|nr:MAG: alpha/beta hydrolase [Aeromicrobium sp.]
MSTWTSDFLGPEYEQRTIDLGTDPDGEGTISATLVRHVGTVDPTEAKQAVIYVHGFTDYFFQTELAEFFANRQIAFYALDLRKCGRSRSAGHTPHYISDLRLYDAELNEAVKIVGEEAPNAKIAFMAHSTGGLVVPLWLDRVNTLPRGVDAYNLNGLILNSPWFDMQGGTLIREVGTPLVRLLSLAIPKKALPVGETTAYGESLHASHSGVWKFDTDLKPVEGFPIRIGWINAVRRGHAAFQRGLNVGVPSLVMRSARSHGTRTVNKKSMETDIVLDVRQIAKWAGCLGNSVTSVPIKEAMHDIFLSRDDVREHAYAVMGDWIDQNLAS